MRSATKPLAVIVIIFAALAGITFIARHAAHDPTPWRTNLQQAQAEAAAAHKPIFLYFAATWCEPCQSMKSETWPDKQVQSALAQFIPVKLDVDQNPTLARQYEIEYLPTFLLVTPQGQPTRRTDGFKSPAELLAWLK